MNGLQGQLSPKDEAEMMQHLELSRMKEQIR